MRDTPTRFAALIAQRHQQMSSEERWQAASAMFDTARAIVLSSLPLGLSNEARRLALARRIYGDELPESMLIAFAESPDRT